MIKTIRLGGKDHPIRLSTGAFTIFEEYTGLDAFEALSKPGNLKRAKNIQSLIYGGVKMGYLFNNEPCPLSFEEVGNLMDIRAIDTYITAALSVYKVDEEIEEKKSLKKVS